MPNGAELNEELEFKERTKKMSTDAKLDYLIDKAYDQHVQVTSLEKKVESMSPPSKKQQLGISGFVSAVVAGIVSAIMSRFGGG